ncbi:MAG: hypothetical protein FJW35_00420, partial [Acidobacteria bacterium]|nr:hypothetical protein [Acidobacteriota bacterium]
MDIPDLIRQASREGQVVRLDEVWNRTEEEFHAQISGHKDIDRVRQGEVCYLYSTDFMARRYAET